MSRRLPARIALAGLALVLAACGSTPTSAPTAAPTAAPTTTADAPTTVPTPSGTPRPAPEVVLPEIRAAVSDIRGLQPQGDVEPTVIDEATLRQNLEAEFDAEYTAEELAVTEDLYATLGLLPPDSSLRELQLDLLGGQVAGYYSPDRDELFVVSRSGGIGPVEWATYAHEFTHQLQDQHFDLGTFGLDATDQTDRALAALSLIEGDATAAQSAWMQTALTPEELGEIVRASVDPAALEVLRRAPAILRETALFPYREGFAFVSAILAGGGYPAVDAAYADPPASTEQVIHPDKYASREAPVEVTIPVGLAEALGAGWTEAGRDTLGEATLRTWLREGGLEGAQAGLAAAGWGGDRAVLLRGPDGALGVALVTEWDSAADADEFANAARTASAELVAGARIVVLGERRVAIAFGDEAEALAVALAE
ncbi:MAG: hypothetical protein FIA92_12700 [Chloroflexi bacterium]|nr:hypothetical protein [Chloroflexota bacterium]